jgi:Leucine-rich repeat (LRR) protein
VRATLQVLGLSDTKIRRIPTDILNSLQKPKALFVSNDQTLVHMPDISQSPSRYKLQTLSLTSNRITNVPIKTISELTATKKLELKNNPLGTLPNLCRIQVPFSLSLAVNTLICDCHLRWFKPMESLGLSVEGRVRNMMCICVYVRVCVTACVRACFCVYVFLL